MPQSWQATNNYIDNILETRSQAEQAEKIKKPRGRPRKVKNELSQVNINDDQAIQDKRVYNTISNKQKQ
jgi:hypothetical protein